MTLNLELLAYSIEKQFLIKDISLSFQRGYLYGILGPNGSGKSTLLKTMSRIWTPTKGKIDWQGQDLLKFSRKAMSQTLSLVPQNPQLYFDFDVYNMVAMGRYPYGCRTLEAQNHIEKALHQVNAWHLRNRLFSELSGGERQRVYIARALVTQAPILLLDEPTSHLDLRHQLEIWHLLRILLKENKLIITVVHDLLAAQRFCDQLIILNHGQCQAVGSYDQVMTPKILQQIFGIGYNDYSNHFEIC